MTPVTPRPHPAKFPWHIIDAIAAHVPPGSRVLDPMAGSGRVHRLRELVPECWTAGVDLEIEWAAWQPGTLVGNALSLPFRDASFTALVTSPTYANRSSDHHEARDLCKTCAGTGEVDGRTCKNCRGQKLSDRNTYRHRLGRMPHPDNSGILAWGPAYRHLHEAVWVECARVLRPGSPAIVNLKNSVRPDGSLRFDLIGWHAGSLGRAGFVYESTIAVETPGYRKGQNGAQRADHEVLLVMRRAGVSTAEFARRLTSSVLGKEWACECGRCGKCRGLKNVKVTSGVL